MVDTDDLLNGMSLRVVLHPDTAWQTDFPDMLETVELRHVLIDGSRFIAKTSPLHALHYKFEYDLKRSYAYAYCNFANVVLNSSPVSGLLRAYRSSAYKEIHFLLRDTHECVWEHAKDKSVESVEEAIRAGKSLKIALHDSDDLWNIHPVHMPSFFVGRNFFELFTEQDALPVALRNFDVLKEIEAQLVDMKAVIFRDPEFYSTFFTVRSDGTYLRGGVVLKDDARRTYKALMVFAERT